MSLWHELKRRNVVRVAIAYVAAAWLILQVVDTVLAYLGHDVAQAQWLLVALVVGFVPTVYVSWKFELTSEGFRPEDEVEHGAPQQRAWATRFDRAITVLLVIAVSYFAIDKFVLTDRGAQLEKSIAVLPFDDMSAAGDQQYFSDGIAEQLLDQLAKLDDLRVVSRSSAFAMRGLELTIPEIASRLNVAYVLEGSVRKHENTVRVTAQLIAAESDEHVWSGTYDGDISDVFGVQDEISKKVVDELKVKLLGQMPAQWVTDPETYDLYLQGLSLLAAREEEGLERSVALFERVIQQDPDFAPAYGKLAMALFWSVSPDESGEVAVEQAVRRALEVDPANSDAYAVMGRHYTFAGRGADAEAALFRAIETGPNNPMAYRWLGTLVSSYDPVRYLQYSKQAYELNRTDPSIWFHQALALGMLGRYGEARAGAANLTGAHARYIGFHLAAVLGWYDGNLEATAKTRYLVFRETGGRETDVRTFLMLDDVGLARAWMQFYVNAAGEEDFRAAINEAEVGYASGDMAAGDAAFERAVKNIPHQGLRAGLAEILVHYNRKPDVAQAIFESMFEDRGADAESVDPYNWRDYLIYAQFLHLLGDHQRAGSLFIQVEKIIQKQLDDGVVNIHDGHNLYEVVGGLLAMKGEHASAIAMLNKGMEQGNLCVHCLRRYSQFDSLRPDPGFEEVLARAAAHAAGQRQKLEEQGMLLTPDQVLALPSFDFDPHNP